MSALDAGAIAQFHRDGFLIHRAVISPENAERLRLIAVRDPNLNQPKANSNFVEGEEEDELPTPLKTMLSHAQYSPGDEAVSAWGVSRRVIAPLEALFGGPARHYYSILMTKYPMTGGWEYHQDYGYHYEQFLRPEGYVSY